MSIFTKYTGYSGKVGVTDAGEYYDMQLQALMKREYHLGAIYYRIGNKRYSWNKCNHTKIEKRIEILNYPF